MSRKNRRKNRQPAGKAELHATPRPIAAALPDAHSQDKGRFQTALAGVFKIPFLGMFQSMFQGKFLGGFQGRKWGVQGYGTHAFIVFGAMLLVYISSMPRVVTYEDAAIFNLSCYYTQPAHPPGYPLYSLLCFPFVHLPFLSVPILGNLLSALFGAAACAFLMLIALHLTASRTAGYLAGLGYGVSKLFWSQSIIQEVYTLHAVLFMAMFLLTLLYVHGRNPKQLKWLALTCGLGVANHWILTVLCWPVLLALLYPVRRDFFRHLGGIKNFAIPLALFALPAVLPYFYLLTTNISTPINFYGPLDTIKKLTHYIARSGYTGTDNQAISLYGKWLYVRYVWGESVAQYGVIFLAFIIGGFVLQWRRWHASVCWALVLLYVNTTFLLVWLVDFKYNQLWTGVFSIYPIVAYCAPALWGALAVERVGVYLGSFARPASARTVTVTASVAMSGLLVASAALSNLGYNQRANDRLAHDYAATVLESFDENAIALLSSDFQLPIMQLNLLEGVREDVTLYNVTGLLLANRYLSPDKDRDREDRAAIEFVRRTDRPVYYFRDFKHEYGIEDFCVYKKIRKDWPAGQKKLAARRELFELWDSAALHRNDLHFDAYAKRTLRRCLVGLALEADEIDADIRDKYQTKMIDGSYPDLLSMIRFLSVFHKKPPPPTTLTELIDKAENRPGLAVSPREDRAALLYAKAYDQINNMKAAQWKDPQAMRTTVEALRQSIDFYPSRENPSVESLMKVLKGLGEDEELQKLRRYYPTVEAGS